MYLAATLDTPGSLKAVGRGRGGEDVDFADCAQRSDSDQKVSLYFFLPANYADVDCFVANLCA